MCRNCVSAARRDPPEPPARVRPYPTRIWATRGGFFFEPLDYLEPVYGTYVAPTTFLPLEPEPQVDDGVDEAVADALRWPLERRKP